jgi:putative ABC transport system substrate-binding protein
MRSLIKSGNRSPVWEMFKMAPTENFRRQLLLAVGAGLAVPRWVFAQQSTVRRIGWPVVTPLGSIGHYISALEQGLRERGYSPGKDVILDVRSSNGSNEKFPELVHELVRSKPDVIVTMLNGATATVQAATKTIPIVMLVVTDAVGSGFVQSLAKPGGNITGMTWDVGELGKKRMDLLKEMLPRTSRMAALWEPPYDIALKSVDEAAAAFRVETRWFKHSGDLEQDFGEIGRWRADTVYIAAGGSFYRQRTNIFQLAAKNKLATACGVSEFVDAGCLFSYGPNIVETVRASTRQIDRIFKGAKPSELPVEQPTRIDLEINLRTAQVLGVKIPQSVLARASRVVQ